MTVPIHSSRQQIKVVIAATVIMMCGFGTMTTVGTFMKPLEAEFGWLRADMSFAYTLFTLGTAGGGLVWGHLRWSLRPTSHRDLRIRDDGRRAPSTLQTVELV